MFVTMLLAAMLLLQVAIAVILVRTYLQTRDAAFIWLGGAVVIWPLVTNALNAGERVLVDRTLRHEGRQFFPFTLVERGDMTMGSLISLLAILQQLVGVCLLLVAVFYLSRTAGNSVRSTR
jgi:hypothetical protein